MRHRTIRTRFNEPIREETKVDAMTTMTVITEGELGGDDTKNLLRIWY